MAHCSALKHTATHCNALQHTATHCNTLQHTATHCTALHHTTTHCNTLQHTATHCNTEISRLKNCVTIHMIPPIADRVAQHLEIICKNFQFSTRRTSILMGFICYLVLIVNPMGRILVRWKSFRNNLEMLCHPTCNWLDIWGMCIYVSVFTNQLCN